MTENKRTVDKYMNGFRRSDHAEILSCLTHDIEWEICHARRQDQGIDVILVGNQVTGFVR
jgi:hypothetical protein